MAWQGKDEPDSVAPWFLRDTSGFQIVSELSPMPDEAVFDKITMSAFEGTPLTLALRDCGLRDAVRNHWEAGTMHCPNAGDPSREGRATRAMANPIRSRKSHLGCLALARKAEWQAHRSSYGATCRSFCLNRPLHWHKVWGNLRRRPPAYSRTRLDRRQAWCVLSPDRRHEKDQEAAAHYQDAAQAPGACPPLGAAQDCIGLCD